MTAHTPRETSHVLHMNTERRLWLSQNNYAAAAASAAAWQTVEKLKTIELMVFHSGWETGSSIKL